MSEAVALEFTDPAGEPFRIEWTAEALAGLAAPTADAEPPWRLAGELDWDEVEGMRILSARIASDLLLGLAAVRPKGVDGHGDELVAAALGDGEHFEQLEEALLSTEYGPDGAVRRIGLELYRDGAGLPIRIAGDVVSSSSESRGGVRRASAAFELRSSGDEGVAILDVLTSAP